jgi:hypothetical protein
MADETARQDGERTLTLILCRLSTASGFSSDSIPPKGRGDRIDGGDTAETAAKHGWIPSSDSGIQPYNSERIGLDALETAHATAAAGRLVRERVPRLQKQRRGRTASTPEAGVGLRAVHLGGDVRYWETMLWLT